MNKTAILTLARDRYPDSAEESEDTVLFELLVEVAKAYLQSLKDDCGRKLSARTCQNLMGCLLQGLKENLEIDHPELRT